MSDTVEKVIDLYIKLRERKAQIEEGVKDKLAGIRSDMTALENWLMEQADAAGVKSFRTDAGTAYTATQDSATVADWSKVLDYVRETENWDLLTKGVAKTVVRDIIEEDGEAPPGVNFSTRRTINVRAPTPE